MEIYILDWVEKLIKIKRQKRRKRYVKGVGKQQNEINDFLINFLKRLFLFSFFVNKSKCRRVMSNMSGLFLLQKLVREKEKGRYYISTSRQSYEYEILNTYSLLHYSLLFSYRLWRC